MLENQITNIYLKEVLQEMCKRVGTNLSEIDISHPNWFLEHSWDREEEKDFEKWLEDYFKNNKKAFKSFYKIPINNKHYRKDAVGWFLLNYGWKYAK